MDKDTSTSDSEVTSCSYSLDSSEDLTSSCKEEQNNKKSEQENKIQNLNKDKSVNKSSSGDHKNDSSDSLDVDSYSIDDSETSGSLNNQITKQTIKMEVDETIKQKERIDESVSSSSLDEDSLSIERSAFASKTISSNAKVNVLKEQLESSGGDRPIIGPKPSEKCVYPSDKLTGNVLGTEFLSPPINDSHIKKKILTEQDNKEIMADKKEIITQNISTPEIKKQSSINLCLVQPSDQKDNDNTRVPNNTTYSSKTNDSEIPLIKSTIQYQNSNKNKDPIPNRCHSDKMPNNKTLSNNNPPVLSERTNEGVKEKGESMTPNKILIDLPVKNDEKFCKNGIDSNTSEKRFISHDNSGNISSSSTAVNIESNLGGNNCTISENITQINENISLAESILAKAAEDIKITVVSDSDKVDVKEINQSSLGGNKFDINEINNHKCDKVDENTNILCKISSTSKFPSTSSLPNIEHENDDDGDDMLKLYSQQPNLQVRKSSKAVSFCEEREIIENDWPSMDSIASDGDSIDLENIPDKPPTKGKNKLGGLGDLNPVYRLSLKLSPMLFQIMDIPSANQHVSPEKTGYLTKLSSRSFPYIPQWRRRYCVLSKGKLYYYEREDSKNNDKNNGVLNLDYFDQICEASPKDSKKASNVFILTSHDKSFFDPGRHYFSADTLTDLHDWMRKLRQSIDKPRNNNKSPTTHSSSNSRRNSKREEKTDRDEGDSRTSTRERKKEKQDTSPKSERTKTEKQEDKYQEVFYRSPQMEENKASIRQKAPLIMEGLLGMAGKGPDNQSQRKDESLQVYDIPETTQKLESITKRRPRPKDRKPPSNRTTRLMKQRASSLSALQQEDQEQPTTKASEGALPSNRNSMWLNRSLDLLEEENVRKHKKPTSSRRAYNYSSDESDEELSRSDSISTSVSGFAPVPPPRNSSFPSNPTPPIPGPKPRPNIPLGSLPSLNGSIHSYHDEWRGSVCSMGASPVMDDLDNYLMNESVQAATPLDSPSSPAGSEISTCKAVEEPVPKSPTPEPQVTYNCKTPDGYSREDLIHGIDDEHEVTSPDLTKLTILTHHLQQHAVQLERDLQNYNSELYDMKNDMVSLRDSMTNIKSSADRVGETVNILSQEAARASRQIVSVAQEAENTRKKAAAALDEAEKTKGEYKKLKTEYDEIVTELRMTINTLKQGAQKHKHTTESQASTSQSSGFLSLERRKNKGTSESSKLSGYQSLFVRPSSIISGLTNKASLTKTVSFVEQESKKTKDTDQDYKKERKAENKNKEEKTEKKNQNSLERRIKSSKSIEVSSPSEPTASLTKTNAQTTKAKVRKYFGEAERAMSNECLDDIPMMDENVDRTERPKSSIGFAKVTQTKSSEINFDLGKSSSTPSVPHRENRPKILAVSMRTPNDSYIPQVLNNNASNNSQSGSIPSLYRPSSACGQIKRQSSMSTVPEDYPLIVTPPSQPPTPPKSASTKQRVFAISRQTSTPNLPLERQNSNPSIPLQRQYSLGTVPEENRLPRQNSVCSIDDRRIGDRTLPISPAESIQCLPEERPSLANIRNSLEMVTGPIIAGSSFPIFGQNTQVHPYEMNSLDTPFATSSLKKNKNLNDRN